MMSPKTISEDRGSSNPAAFRHTPLQIVHVIGNFLRIWSVYSMYRYLSQTGASVVLFIFCCLVPSAIIFIALQKPWKGRSLSNTQVVPSIINGGITALYFILWGKGLKSCGPLRAIMAEYSGAVLGVLSAVLYGRKGHVWKKVAVLHFYEPFALFGNTKWVDSLQCWHLCTSYLKGGPWPHIPHFISFSNMNNEKIFCNVAMYLTGEIPFNDDPDTKDLQEEQAVGMNAMIVPTLAGILSALRRVIARRVSLKGSTSDSSIELPFSAWALLSTSLFGIVLIFYVDSIAEERLHMVFSSPRHLMAAGGCIIVLEIVYKMNFSLPGFLICSILLGFVSLQSFFFTCNTGEFMKQLLWSMLGRILCRIQIHQQGYLETKFRCLHYQLKYVCILGFIHVASNFLATKSCKCLSFDFFLLVPKIGRKEFSSSGVNSSDARVESLLLDSLLTVFQTESEACRRLR
ncbi:hypothetical protein RHSIM_Rhsim10G0067300 [Rhododendron simsii]|uniref:Uncharacterized protein n=1 Tax=Rhododendron simsii TaxID=118357 RepID=A0A834G9Q4_RHOSS|nr:hypothetical protein RHSIM_Rhsim10G0067300 [Rhododendron simsii]